MKIFSILREAFELDQPTGRVGIEIADLQKVLVSFGYELPKHGVDGVNGPETTEAIRRFQRDAHLNTTGKPDPETISLINATLEANPQVADRLVKSTQADVRVGGGHYDITDDEIQQMDPIPTSRDSVAAKDSCAKYLGRDITDDEWNYLVRATIAEASMNKEEYAMVMGSILNRARDYGKNGIIGALMAPNQFQAVTGTRVNGHAPSANFVRGPNDNQMKMFIYAAVNILPRVSREQRNFTAASAAAYGPGTNIGYRDQMIKGGGVQKGGTIFNTDLA